MTLGAREFMRRFLLHVLPGGFHRIRHYGLLANPMRRQNLAKVRGLLHVMPAASTQPEDTGPAVRPAFICRHCGAPMIVIEVLQRSAPIRAPPAQRAPAGAQVFRDVQGDRRLSGNGTRQRTLAPLTRTTRLCARPPVTNAGRTASLRSIPSTSTRLAPALRQSNVARNLFNPHSAKGSGRAGTLRGFLPRGLYDACPHAPVARAHVRGRGQASYKPKQTRAGILQT